MSWCLVRNIRSCSQNHSWKCLSVLFLCPIVLLNLRMLKRCPEQWSLAWQPSHLAVFSRSSSNISFWRLGCEDTYGRCGSSRSAARCCVWRWTAVLVFGQSRAGWALWAGAWGWWWWCCVAGALRWPRALLPEDPGSAGCPLTNGRRRQASEESCPSGWLSQRSGSGSVWSDTSSKRHTEKISFEIQSELMWDSGVTLMIWRCVSCRTE